jgi:hypothetical protein
MRESRIRPNLAAFLVLLMTVALLGACDEEGCLCEPPSVVTASGKVLDLGDFEGGTVPGASIQLITNEFPLDDPDYLRPCECLVDLCDINTVSDENGLWAMDVPVKYTDTWIAKNMLMKVSKDGIVHYNLYQPDIKNDYQGDLQLIPQFLYSLISAPAIAEGADPDELAVMMGVAIGFAEMGYPGVQDLLEGVTVTAQSLATEEEYPVTYLGEAGLPDPELTGTSSQGVFYYAVPDARYTAAPSIQVMGDKPGSVFVTSFFPACPGSATGNAVIDPYYRPEDE